MKLHNNLFVVSDLHVGDPRSKLEDFFQDEAFESLILRDIPAASLGPASLVIAGDFIDFAQILPELSKHDLGECIGSSEVESLAKIEIALTGHRRVFSALRKFTSTGNTVAILPGNHDIDLHWPLVWQRLASEIESIAGSVSFYPTHISLSNIYIEHGNQYSFDNRFEHWGRPFIKTSNGLRLERPWGTYFMDQIYNDLEVAYPFINKVVPHSKYAWIVARSFWDKENVSARMIARLMWFFATKGKEMIVRHLLGEGIPPIATIDDIFRAIDADIHSTRGALLVAELHALGAKAVPLSSSDLEAGTLGDSDVTGQKERARDLQESGESAIVVFGHTHKKIDENRAPPWGINDPRRFFNTGTWIPAIMVSDTDSPHWSDLEMLQSQTAQPCLYIDSNAVRARFL